MPYPDCPQDITKSNLVKQVTLSDRYIKRWLSMLPHGTLANIHARQGLSIRSFSHIYKESHAVSHATSHLKADREVNVPFSTHVASEEKWTYIKRQT